MHSCEFCKIFKNDYLAVNVRSATSDILGYPQVGLSSARSTLKKCTVFFSFLVFIYFKQILESSTISGVYQNCNKYLRCRNSPLQIFGKVLHTSLQPSFLIFSTFLTFFVCILESIYEHFAFLLKVCSYTAHLR